MNPRLEKLRDSLAQAVAPVQAALQQHRRRAEVVALTLAVLAVLGAWGQAAYGRAAALRAQAVELHRTTENVREIVASYAPPDSLEPELWRASEIALVTLAGEAGPDALAVSRLVAYRAEEAGVGNLRLRLTGGDEVAAVPSTELPGWVISPGERGIGLEFTGRWEAIVALLGSLPSEVEVASLQLTGQPGSLLRGQLLLVTRHLQRTG